MTRSDAVDGTSSSTSVVRLRLMNYRSIRQCDVALGRLTFLVGPNGAGKSNFLDALHLVADALTTSLDQAVRQRGGYSYIRRRSTGKRETVRLDLDLRLLDAAASYEIEMAGTDGGRFEVVREQCSVAPSGPDGPTAWFRMQNGKVDSSEPILPAPPPGRLYLVTAANLPAFEAIFDALSRMGFYNLNPDSIRDLQTPDTGELLARDGRNAASVLQRMAQEAPGAKKTVEEYLSVIVPGVIGVDRETLGPRETLRFRQAVPESPIDWRFNAQSMSDGTLRALGVLLAALQRSERGGDLALVGIEEPEAAVHPAAAAVLRDALVEASQSRQIIVTTHSPELLDDPDLDPTAVLSVDAPAGETLIGRPDRAGLSALRDRLYTAGELLRIGQLMPDVDIRGPVEP